MVRQPDAATEVAAGENSRPTGLGSHHISTCNIATLQSERIAPFSGVAIDPAAVIASAPSPAGRVFLQPWLQPRRLTGIRSSLAIVNCCPNYLLAVHGSGILLEPWTPPFSPI